MSDDERIERTNCPQSGDEPNALSALKSAESHLTASTAASGEGDGGGSDFTASFNAFLDWAEKYGLIRPQQDFPFFLRFPDGHGNEHEVWFDEPSNRWFKATYPNQFGIAWGRSGSATPGEYLTRLVLQNEYFGDDIHLIALANCDKKLRVITSQPHIFGDFAPYEEIEMWFLGLGFCRFESCGSLAWYQRDTNLLISDAHEGNVIRSETGALFAIDLNLMKPKGKMRKLVISLLKF